MRENFYESREVKVFHFGKLSIIFQLTSASHQSLHKAHTFLSQING